MTFYGARHSTTDVDPKASARQASENARDANEALARKLSAHAVVVPRYIADGNTSARITLEASVSRPLAVVLIQAAPADDPSGVVPLVPALNFLWSPTAGSIDVYEPEGLVKGQGYHLTFLVVEA